MPPTVDFTSSTQHVSCHSSITIPDKHTVLPNVSLKCLTQWLCFTSFPPLLPHPKNNNAATLLDLLEEQMQRCMYWVVNTLKFMSQEVAEMLSKPFYLPSKHMIWKNFIDFDLRRCVMTCEMGRGKEAALPGMREVWWEEQTCWVRRAGMIVLLEYYCEETQTRKWGWELSRRHLGDWSSPRPREAAGVAMMYLLPFSSICPSAAKLQGSATLRDKDLSTFSWGNTSYARS